MARTIPLLRLSLSLKSVSKVIFPISDLNKKSARGNIKKGNVKKAGYIMIKNNKFYNLPHCRLRQLRDSKLRILNTVASLVRISNTEI